MPISLELEPALEQKLMALSERTGRTTTDYLREAIERGLQDIEDIDLADAAMERIRSGGERTYTSDEVRRELGLDG
ncbi:ribbon-helix-helix domain-containing protein [Arvimicrobium flavum]|uniref:type II toxin-antitoxin system RelB family antitoxin n=1 Tax=Arvimicrobium flavum TaxID=3393320 RepID=UPI00237BB0C5|nr:ribbon-helix-helix domain-containing protein [Mesorhizobium shangrilense]